MSGSCCYYLERLDEAPAAERWPLARRWIVEEPLAFGAELRLHRPVLDLGEVVLASRHADCAHVLRRHDLFSVALYRPKQGDYWMAQDDTAAHWREKSIMAAILDREDVPAVRAWVGEKAAGILAAAGGSIDAVDGLARAVPIALVQEWFGFADSDPAELRRWSYWNQMDAFWNQPFDAPFVADPAAITRERESANLAMRDYLVDLVKRRAGELQSSGGGNDPVSRLLRLMGSKGVRLDPTRIVLNLGGLLIGAVETTSHAVVNAVGYLLARPDLLTAARAAAARGGDAAAFDGHVYEALRFDPAFAYFFRVCERDTALARGTDHETPVAAGRTVLGFSQAAMHDPAAFPDPARFDPARDQGGTFHFGMGLHECLGWAIGAAMIPEIVRRALLLDGLEAGDVDRRGGPVPESWSWRWRPA